MSGTDEQAIMIMKVAAAALTAVGLLVLQLWAVLVIMQTVLIGGRS